MSKTVVQALLQCRNRDNSVTAFSYKQKRSWKSKTWQEFYRDVEALGAGLLQKDIQPGERVAILANTSYNWAISDFAILGCGAVTVPIYPNSIASEIEFIINDSEPKILFLESDAHLAKWKTIEKKCPSVETVVVFDSNPWNSLSEKGLKQLKSHPRLFTDACDSVTLKQNATIIYTSGTSGKPKGVLLTHRQIVSEVGETFAMMGVGPKDTSLTFLPYAHVFGRIELWGAIYNGFNLAFAESIERLKGNFIEIKPTIFIGVPRIFEKIYQGVVSQIESSKYQAKIFKWAMQVGREKMSYTQRKAVPPLALIGQFKLADKLIFEKVRERLGGAVRFAVSGGAPLGKDVAEFFHIAGVPVLEGYGLSETTAAITVNRPFDFRVGTVGKPIGDVQIKIAEDGEILVKSDKVMKEYWNDEEATKHVLKDGYFYTGDIGELTSDGFLKITDRKKDLIKTAGGKYVVPQKIEGLLRMHPLISHVLIHGDQRKYVVALITLDDDNLKRWFKDKNIIDHDKEWTRHPKLRAEIQNAVVDTNHQLSSFETIKAFDILPEDFSLEKGELTQSLKVKRKMLDQKYRSEIERLYSLND